MVQRDAGGSLWTWKKVTVVVDSEAAENVMPKSMVPDVATESTGRSKNGKVFKGPGGEHIKSNWQQAMSVRSPEGLFARARGSLQM